MRMTARVVTTTTGGFSRSYWIGCCWLLASASLAAVMSSYLPNGPTSKTSGGGGGGGGVVFVDAFVITENKIRRPPFSSNHLHHHHHHHHPFLTLGRKHDHRTPSSSSSSPSHHLPPIATNSQLFGSTSKRGRGISALLASEGTSSDATSSLSSSSSSEDSKEERKIDFSAIGKYGLALIIQMTLFFGFFTTLDKLIIPLLGGKPMPTYINIPMFYMFALKSRIFNPLSNQRPLPKTKEIDGDTEPERVMPSWTPPGFIFPIVWLLLIGPLRAVTSNMIVQTSGNYVTKALMALMLHLSIGDVWNTINNVERRYGTSVLGVTFGVYGSTCFAAYQYYLVNPMAGKLLSFKLIWLTIASSLIIRTWQLNKNPKTGKPYSLLPKIGEGSNTKLVWFESDD